MNVFRERVTHVLLDFKLIAFVGSFFPAQVDSRLVGRWQGECAGGYHDNSTYGADVYEFTADWKVISYMRFYMDSRCQEEGFDGERSEGFFDLTHRLGDFSGYTLKILWSAEAQSQTFKHIAFDSRDVMQVCDHGGCESFTRKQSAGKPSA